MAEKAELIITALQQRMGEIVANYETQIAVLRAEITILMEQSKKQDALAEYANSLEEKISGVE
jgi:phage host-nuclease inhibitor protein Gam